MKVKVGEEQIEDQPVEAIADPEAIEPDLAAIEAERVRKLELENARLQGEIAGRSAGSPSSQAQADQWKTQFWTDVNSLPDDEFRTRYQGLEKHQATARVLQNDLQSASLSQKQQIAELRAENRMAIKYRDFNDYKAEIDELVSFAAPEVRQDPDKLHMLMEKAYLAAAKDKPAQPGRSAPVNRGRISGGFEKPVGRTEHREDAPQTDEVLPEYRELGRHFGVTSEKERQRLMESVNVDMDLGNGTMLVGRDIVKKDAVQV